jgi:nucleoid-associated protein YgaU
VDGGKFLLAGGLMVAGFGGAMTFRSDGPPVAAAPASPEFMVRRVVEPIETARPLSPQAGVDVAARLTGRVEPHALAGRPAVAEPRVAGDYELTSALGPAPSGEAYDERTPRYNRVLRATNDWPEVDGGEASPPPSLPAESPFRTHNAALTSVDGPTETSLAERTHSVRDGDTLGTLAERYYGDAGRYREILEANREVLSSADLLPIGTQLRIPAVDARGATPPAPPPAARIVPRLEFHPAGGR